VTRWRRRADEPLATRPAEQPTEVKYLDVWEQDVGGIEDPALDAIALGGPDTGPRTLLPYRYIGFVVAGLAAFIAWLRLRRAGSKRLLRRRE
jgi:hypothetical protein